MKKRVITGIGIALVAIPLIILGGWWSIGLFSFIAAVSIWEILKTKRNSKWPFAVYFVTVVFSFMMLYWPFISAFRDGSIESLTIPSPFLVKENFILIIAFLLAILICEVGSHHFFINDAFYIFTMVLFITTACQGLMFIRLSFGLKGIAYIFLISFICDCFAHIFGSKFGKKKLAPTISPHKTWFGAVMGVAGATLFGFLYYLIFPFYEVKYAWIVCLIMSFVLAVGAVIGDLIFSSIKRQNDIKDFSELFPGHGGMLDRCDSLLFNTLLFVAMYFIVVQGMNILL